MFLQMGLLIMKFIRLRPFHSHKNDNKKFDYYLIAIKNIEANLIHFYSYKLRNNNVCYFNPFLNQFYDM